MSSCIASSSNLNLDQRFPGHGTESSASFALSDQSLGFTNKEILQEEFFSYILEDYWKLTQQLSPEIWKALSEEERSLLLAGMENNNLLHKAVKNRKMEWIEFFYQLGMNINGIDSKGKTPLQYALKRDIDSKRDTPFLWLHVALKENIQFFISLFSKGARFPEEQGGNKALLEDVLSLHHIWRQKPPEEYENFLLEIIKLCTFQELMQLNKTARYCVFVRLCIEYSEIQKFILSHLRAAMLSPLHYPLAIQGIKDIFHSKAFCQSTFTWLLLLRLQGVLTSSSLEEVLSDPISLHCYSEYYGLLSNTKYGWKPSAELKIVMNSTQDNFLLAFRIHAILQSRSLKKAAYALAAEIDKADDSEMAELLKGKGDLSRKIVEHIEQLQKREKRGFWQVFDRRRPYVESVRKKLCFLESIGLNPNWSDPNSGEHLLFTTLASNIGDPENPCQIRVDLHKRNKQGDNALEYHCRGNYVCANGLRRQLVRAGLRLSKNFPFSEKSQQLFPKNPFLQTEMVYLLLHPDYDHYHDAMIALQKSEMEAIDAAIRNDKEAFALLGEVQRTFSSWLNQERWKIKNKFYPQRLPSHVSYLIRQSE